MGRIALLVSTLLVSALAGRVSAQEAPDTPSRLAELEKEVAELRKAVSAKPPPAGEGPSGAAPKSDKKDEPKDEKPAQWIIGDNLTMTARWNNGLMLESADKAFRVHPVGRVQPDLVFMSAGDRVQFARGGVGRVDDGVAFRRLRFGFEGTIWKV